MELSWVNTLALHVDINACTIVHQKKKTMQCDAILYSTIINIYFQVISPVERKVLIKFGIMFASIKNSKGYTRVNHTLKSVLLTKKYFVLNRKSPVAFNSIR